MKDFGTTKEYDVKIKSFMGEVKAYVHMETINETSFRGHVKLMGISSEFSEGISDGNNHKFIINLPLPFGKTTISIDADVDENGIVTGVAVMSKRKPMELTGVQVARADS